MTSLRKLTSYFSLCTVPVSIVQAISFEKFNLEDIPIESLKTALDLNGLSPEPSPLISGSLTRELAPNQDYSSFDLVGPELDTNVEVDFEYNNDNIQRPRSSKSGSVAFRAMLQSAFMGINIDNYGCWCIFGDKRDKARGPTMNNVDRLCKSLQRGYDCVIIDENNENQSNSDQCVPWDVDYNFDFSLIGDIPTMCKNSNPRSSCKTRSCMVEMKFMLSYLSEVFKGTINTDDQFSHNNGFDFNNECKRPSPDVNPEKACCGDYPERYSYRTVGGVRACCNNRTYNTQLFTCCQDGSISMSLCG